MQKRQGWLYKFAPENHLSLSNAQDYPLSLLLLKLQDNCSLSDNIDLEIYKKRQLVIIM